MADEETQKEVEKNIENEKTEVGERKATINQETGKVNIHRPEDDDKHKGMEEKSEYVCPKCGRNYTSKNWFQKHLRQEHSLELEGEEGSEEREKSPKELERVDPGVPGLKEITGGGFIDDSTNLITGGPGSGKSTLAMQIALANIEKKDIPVVYITFEQTEEDILRDMGRYGWDIEVKDSDKGGARFDIHIPKAR